MQTNQSSDLVKIAIALMDLALMSLAFFLATRLRFGSFAQVSEFIWLFYLSSPLILLLLLRNGVLTGFRFQSLTDILKSTVLAFVVAGVVTSTILYLSKTADYSRLVFGNYFALSFVFIALEKVVVKKLFDRHLRSGGLNIPIAMVGFGNKFEEILGEISERPQWGIRPALVIDPQLEDARSIISKIRGTVVDEVYIVYPRSVVYHEQIDALLNGLEQLGMPVRIALNFDEFQYDYGQHSCRMGTKSGILLAPQNLDPDQIILKRVIDLAGAVVGLLLLGLIFPFVAVAIKRDSPGPLFFAQRRVGKGGREFRIYKFRSMYMDAEVRKRELLDHNLHDGPIFKMENDPRVTPVGRFIRKYSLDEVPQFWNVLKGEMSLVGTRPPTPEEVAQYEDRHFRRISIKPGLTGLWQVSGRNKIVKFDEVVALDSQYISQWNLWLDVRIILRTLLVVVSPRRGGVV